MFEALNKSIEWMVLPICYIVLDLLDYMDQSQADLLWTKVRLLVAWFHSLSNGSKPWSS